MRSNTRKWKERIMALALALTLVLGSALPQGAAVAKAAGENETVKVEFIANVENPQITVKDNMSAEEGIVVEKDQQGKYVFEFETNKTYSYTVSKQGYDTVEEKNYILDGTNSEPIRIDLNPSKIQLDVSELIDMNVDGTQELHVTNVIEEATYSCVSSNSQYLSVEETESGWKLIALPLSGSTNIPEQVTVTVRNDKGSTETEINVRINKIQLKPEDFSIKANPNEGADKKSITYTLIGLNPNATGTIRFMAGEETQEVILPVTSWTYELPEGAVFEGEQNVTANYSGDERYSSVNVSGTTGQFLKNVPLKIKSDALTSEGEAKKEFEYGSEEKKFQFPIDANTIKDRKIDYQSAAPEVATVDENGEITLQKAGTAVISAIAERQGNYEKTSVEYTVVVTPANVEIEDITWDNVSKVYDGNKEIELTGTLKNNQSEKIVIEKKNVTVESENVVTDSGKDKTPKAQAVTIAAGNYKTKTGNYQLIVKKDNNTISDIAVVSHRPVYLTSKTETEIQLSLQYGQDLKAETEKVESGLVHVQGEKGRSKADSEGKNTGLINEDTISEAKLPNATLKYNEQDVAKLYVGKFEAITPNITNDNKYCGNYEFKTEENGYKGILDVARQELSLEIMLSNIAVEGQGVHEVRDAETLSKIWARVGAKAWDSGDTMAEKPSDAKIELSVKNSKKFTAADYYDKVYISIGGEFINATDNGLKEEDWNVLKAALGETDSEPVKVKLYLANSEHLETKTNENETTELLRVDNKAPKVDITGYKATAYSKIANALTFGLFTNQMYTAEVSIADAGSGIPGSNQQYYVEKLGSDITNDTLKKETIKDKINKIDQAGDWEDCIWNTDGKCTIKVGEAENDKDISNNYLIFLKTVDNVGNCAVYVSNGIVIEQKKPEIACEFSEENQIKIGNALAYDEDAEYTLTVTDGGDFKSGLSEIEVTVTDNEKEVEGSTGEVCTNSYIVKLDKQGSSDSGYTYEEIEGGSKYEISGKITAENIESNNVKMTVTAKDKSGNEAATFEQNLILDKKDPVIDVAFENENVSNGRYYQGSQTMKITYFERNFNVEGVLFKLRREGEENYSEYSLKALDELPGIEVGEVTDSESKVTNENGYTEGRSNTVRIEFTEQNTYDIGLYCKDKLGNVQEKSEVFVVDTEDPTMDISYQYYDEEKGEYTGYDPVKAKSATVRVNITINEHYFAENNDKAEFEEGQVDFKILAKEAYNSKGEYLGETFYQNWMEGNANIKENWETEGDKRTLSLEFKDDANYVLDLSYTDLSGRKRFEKDLRFTVDKTAPTGEIFCDGQPIGYQFLEIITFGIFSNKDVNLKLKYKDNTAGVKNAWYYKYNPGLDKVDENGNVKGLTREELDSKKLSSLKVNDNGENDLLITSEEQVIIYEKIEDKAGNVTYLNSKDGVIVDKTNPGEPKIEIITEQPVHGIFNKDVKVKLSVEDTESGGTYSGLKEVSYEILKDGKVTQNHKEEFKPSARKKSYVKDDLIISAKDNNSNNVTIKVTAVDYAGNPSKAEKKIKIDITPPVVESFKWNTNAASNGKYYNTTRTATITVRERNFDENQVRLNLTNTDGTMPQISNWTVDKSGTSDDNLNICTVTFAADGDYTMSMSCTDLAGNTSNTVTENEFTIDKTVPRLNVSFDNNSVKNGKYYDAARTATITVDEHNFNGSDVNTAITSSTVTPGVHGWSNSGNSHSATVPFTADGEYSFTVNYTDLAGNPAQAYNVDEFTIDQTKPEVEIFDIEDKSANNGEVAPGVRYSDTNHDVNGVSITYSGAKHAEQEVDGARSAIPNGESIKMADFEHTPETDDVYTMVAKVTDLAGNSDEKTVTFSVNRFGSNFLFSEDTEKFLDDYYNNEEEELVVTEINVDTLTHRGITCGHDGDTEDFKEGTEYTVKESGTEVSWKSYEYTIKKNNFEKEGMYNITIDSVDRATNQVNNKIKEADIEFVIDKTAPTVVINGIEDKGQYRTSERDITIATADNMAMDRVELYVDDEKDPAESYNAKTIQREGGELPYTLNSSSDWQEVKAVAIDKAGNVTDTSRPEDGDEEKWLSVLVTSNVFVQFYRNTPLVIGSVVGLAALIGIIFLILAKRRKQEESIEE